MKYFYAYILTLINQNYVFPSGNKCYKYSTYEVLVATDPNIQLKWVNDRDGHVPANAVVGACCDGENVYLGQMLAAPYWVRTTTVYYQQQSLRDTKRLTFPCRYGQKRTQLEKSVCSNVAFGNAYSVSTYGVVTAP